MCIRDDKGWYVLAQTLWTNPIRSTNVDFESVIRYSVGVHELQLSNVDFELDVKRVVDCFNKGKNVVMVFGTIVDECKRCCQVNFENSQVEFSRRQSNVVAHTLARETRFSSSPHIFIEVASCIIYLISNEMQ